MPQPSESLIKIETIEKPAPDRPLTVAERIELAKRRQMEKDEQVRGVIDASVLKRFAAE